MNRPFPHAILQFGSPQRSLSRRVGAVVRSNRFTLTGALLFAYGLPLLLGGLTHAWPWFASSSRDIYGALIISFVSVVETHIILSKVGELPLVDDKVLVLPSAISIFTLNTALIAFVYGDLAGVLVAASFCLTVIWYLVVAMARARLTFPRLAFVGGLPADVDLLARRIDWVPLTEAALPHDVVGIIFDREAPLTRQFERLFSRAALRHVPIYELGHFREMLTGRVTLRSSPAEVFGQLLPGQPYLRAKRVIDTLVAIPVLAVMLPALVLAAAIIRLESPGSAIFRQKRIGYRGRPFTCYKFRTMRVGLSGPAYTVDGDPRITRIGRLFRKWRIDELPQIVNIIKGDMSWIGPRPESVPLARAYQKEIPFYSYRHTVRPGITGWAAVHQGNVALGEAAQLKLEFDFYYIRYFSVWLDLLIGMMTVRTIVTGFGAK